jgi:DNA damage-binding protein 2
VCRWRRLRIWDYLLSLDGPPDREIVHSHDFNRYLTPFRAEWDPKDPAERTIVVGR